MCATFASLTTAYFKIFKCELHYKTHEYTYSSEEGYSLSEATVPIKSNLENKTYIKVYEPWNMQESRQVRVYDVTDVNLNELEEYLDYDLDGLEYEVYTESLRDVAKDGKLNSEEIKEVVKNIVYKDDLVYRKIIYSIILYIVFIMILLWLDFFTYNSRWNYRDETLKEKLLSIFPIGLIFNYSRLSDFQNNIKVNIACYKKNVLELMDNIYANEELRNRFVELFNENKHLLNDPNLLIEKYKEAVTSLDIGEIKEKNEEYVKFLGGK